MNKRVFLLWPLVLAPFAALATLWVSGSTFTTAPDQGAMLVRFLALMLWLVVSCVGGIVTAVILKAKKPMDWGVLLLAVIGSVLVFYTICVGVN